jgi:hypothetical protein
MTQMNRAEMLSAMARRTGLKRETIKDLMKSGWHYEELANEPAKFIGPLGRVRKLNAAS